MFCHNHKANTTLSPLPGQAALRGESGCSHQKVLPGKRRIEFFDVFHLIVELLVGDAACLSSQVRCCAGLLRRGAVAACWRSACEQCGPS